MQSFKLTFILRPCDLHIDECFFYLCGNVTNSTVRIQYHALAPSPWYTLISFNQNSKLDQWNVLGRYIEYDSAKEVKINI